MPKKVLLVLVLIGGLLSLVFLASSQSTASKSLTKAEPSTTPSAPSKEAVSAKLATLERGWVKNEGQWDERALFSAPGFFGTTWITKNGELLHVVVKKEECKDKTEKAKACPSKSWVISERWVGGKVQTIMPEEELPTKVSYFIGNDPSKHKTNLSTYRYVSLGEVWSGIEVKLKATQKTLEKLFYVKPGADPSKIVVEVGGAKGLKLSKDGEIIIKTGLGELKLSKPIAWQEKDGKKLPVEVSYKLIGKNRYSFKVAKADPSLPIVIDPILRATYLGGTGYDSANAIAISGSDVYVVGETNSIDFSSDTTRDSDRIDSDAFVAKLDSSLNLLRAIYLGGSGNDVANAIAISGSDVYVVGETNSNNFPGATSRASSRTDFDAFVAKLNSSLNLIQATYLGGTGYDSANALAISGSDVYVVGVTNSNDFSSDTTRASSRTDFDAFVAKLDSSLNLLRATYLGGTGYDSANAIAISGSDVYVVGVTNSNDFSSGTTRASSRTDLDAFVAKLNSSLNLLQATYLGGTGNDDAKALAISGSDVYVVGETDSNNFLGATPRASSRTDFDAFVAKLNSSLNLIQATYLGGTGNDDARALAISGSDVYVVGVTNSNDFSSDTTRDSSRTDQDAFVAELDSDLNLLRATYLGGTGYDRANALAISGSDVYVVGVTNSNDFSSGTTRDSSRTDFDAFVAKLSADLTGSGDGGDPSGGSSGGGSGGGSSGGGSGGSSSGGGSGGGSSGGGSGGGSSGGSSGGSGGGGGGCSMTGSSFASLWNILVWLFVPFFALARRIRRK